MESFMNLVVEKGRIKFLRGEKIKNQRETQRKRKK
jgi:hypothetical protein